MKFTIYLTLILLLSFMTQKADAGNYPFPRNIDYPYGQKPTNAAARHALLAYQNWKIKYYDEMPDNTARVFFNSSKEVVSEGIAYGMLLSVYADDKDVFDKLWRYYLKHSNDKGLMHWQINGDDKVIGFNGATDSDEDAAMALIVANYQWGSDGDIDYQSAAIKLINAIMKYDVEVGTFRLKCGDGWGTNPTTNPSYFAPAYYKIFHQITGDADWLKVVDKCYEILEKNADPVTGLVSDWCDVNGLPIDKRKYEYTYDACRFPWRIATDYLWFGDERAEMYCNKMSAFVKSKGGSKKINGTGYTKSGTSLGGGHNAVFVSTFALTGMASDPSNQKDLEDAYTDVIQTNETEYFGATLRALSLMMLSGNFYKMPEPVCESPNLGPDVSLCDFPDLVLQTGFSDETGKKFVWSDGSTGNTLAITKPGIYWLKTDSSSCIRRDSVTISSFEASIGPDREIPMEGDSLVAIPAANDITYQWSTGESSQSIFIKKEGTYWVRADSSGCIDTASIVITKKYPPEKTLYPNPAKDARFKIYIRDSLTTAIQVQIYYSNGAKGSEYNFALQPEQEVHDIHLSGLTEGLYIAKLKYTTIAGQIGETIQKIFIR